MSDISTKYLGLELENPIIIASGPLTGDLEHLKACQEAAPAPWSSNPSSKSRSSRA